MMIKLYRKKPVIIEALLYTGGNALEASQFVGAPYRATERDEVYINTLEGEMHVSVGDYIIKGVKGEFYPCKPDIFAATYEPVEPTNSKVEEPGK